jgi:spermidine synthase
MQEPKSCKWFLDFLNPDEGHMHGIKTILFAKQTKYQQVEIMDTGSYGRCLVLDGKIQSSEQDEFIYHEALVHAAMLSHPDPKRIFVVGGGEGATLREILRHKTVEYALMVDIDQEVVESCKKHLPEWHQGAFDDPRVDLKFLDARKYLEETNDRYDIIVIDISEPVEEGPAYLLYTKEFYSLVQNRLTPNGLITLQAGTTALTSLLCLGAVYQTLKAVFPIVAPYEASIPSFGLPWGFILASKSIDPRKLAVQEIDEAIKKRIRGELRYYDGETHTGQFRLGKHIRREIEKEDRIIEDNHPLYTYH